MNDDERPSDKSNGRRLKWQFGLRGLLTFTVAVAVFFAFVKWWGVAGFITFWFLAIPVWLSRRGKSADLPVIKYLVAYFCLSLMTLPFLDSVWLGEIPPLVIVQVPKVQFAGWLRGMVMAAMKPLGISRGSFSPDYLFARPYALALAYCLPLSVVISIVSVRTRLAPPYRFWTCVLVVLAVIDFILTLRLTGGPGFTIY